MSDTESKPDPRLTEASRVVNRVIVTVLVVAGCAFLICITLSLISR